MSNDVTGRDAVIQILVRRVAGLTAELDRISRECQVLKAQVNQPLSRTPRAVADAAVGRIAGR